MKGATTPDELSGTQRMREFAFGHEDFEALRALVKELTGINLTEQKRELVYGRLARRLRALGLRSFRDYRDLLASDGDELVQLCNAITTNLTAFFRESHHFGYLREQVLRRLAADARASRRVRIWSAGCSSGEEPYTIALILNAEIKNMTGRDVRILATDIDTEVLRKASLGVFAADAVEAVPVKYREVLSQVERGDKIAIDRDVCSLISFGQLNLMGEWPMRGPFDAIFCRNVMIYFDQQTKAELVERFTDLIRIGGWLYIGHSESLIGSHPRLKLAGRTIYRRTA